RAVVLLASSPSSGTTLSASVRTEMVNRPVSPPGRTIGTAVWVYVSVGASNPEWANLPITTWRGLAVVVGSSLRITQSVQFATLPAFGPWFFTVQVTRTVAGSAMSRALSTETEVTT